MTSVVFFAMVIALVTGVACFFLSALFRLGEKSRRFAFFMGCMLGFWAASVQLLADDMSNYFGTVQVGMEESVRNAFRDHWLKAGHGPGGNGAGTGPLCKAADLKASAVPDCALAVGVNSTAVCRQWILYVPFLLPLVKPCPALRTTADVLADDGARQALVAAINAPCDYLSTGADVASKRIRKALGCGDSSAADKVVLIVDHPDHPQTWILRRGDIRLP
jgi:hypothetical protein